MNPAPSIQPIRTRWKGLISDRERFNRQMHYQPVDRCFNMEFGYWDENFTEWNIFRDHQIRNNEEADIFFNFDRTASIGGENWMSPPFQDEIIEIRETTKVLMNSDGLLAEVPLDGHDTIPHYIKSSITTPDDWKKVKAERFNLDSPSRPAAETPFSAFTAAITSITSFSTIRMQSCSFN